MAQATDIAIVSGARTPMGRYCGKLRDFTAMDLAAVAARKRSGARASIPQNSTMPSSATRSRRRATRSTARGTLR